MKKLTRNEFQILAKDIIADFKPDYKFISMPYKWSDGTFGFYEEELSSGVYVQVLEKDGKNSKDSFIYEFKKELFSETKSMYFLWGSSKIQIPLHQFEEYFIKYSLLTMPISGSTIVYPTFPISNPKPKFNISEINKVRLLLEPTIKELNPSQYDITAISYILYKYVKNNP